MKRLLNKSYILALIVFAGIAALIGMIAGPLGYEAESMGASFSACIIAALVIFIGLYNWRKRR